MSWGITYTNYHDFANDIRSETFRLYGTELEVTNAIRQIQVARDTAAALIANEIFRTTPNADFLVGINGHATECMNGGDSISVSVVRKMPEPEV